MGLAKFTEYNGSKKVDNNKDVRVSVVRGRKIPITTTSVIFVGGKLSAALTKMTLQETGQNMRVKNIWIETTR